MKSRCENQDSEYPLHAAALVLLLQTQVTSNDLKTYGFFYTFSLIDGLFNFITKTTPFIVFNAVETSNIGD